jgi:hypothetical protein
MLKFYFFLTHKLFRGAASWPADRFPADLPSPPKGAVRRSLREDLCFEASMVWSCRPEKWRNKDEEKRGMVTTAEFSDGLGSLAIR